MSGGCPTDDLLDRLLASQLSAAEERALDLHVAHCEVCQQRLEQLTRLPHSVHSPLPSSGAPSDDSPRSGGILARLANSSQPLLHLVKQHEQKSRRTTDSLALRLSSSTISASGEILRRQFWIWPLIAALLLGSLGWWISRSIESAMQQQRIAELTTVLDADMAALDQWMENQCATSELVATDESLRPMVLELVALADETPAAQSALVRAPAQSTVRSRLAKPLRRGGFTGFLLVSPAGITLAADEDAPVGEQLSGYRRDFFAAVNDGNATVSKPFLSPLLLSDPQGQRRADQPCMYAAAAIHDSDSRPIAALGIRIRPDDQFTRILHVAQCGESGETYAFDRRGVLLSQSRFDDQLKQIGLLVDRPNSNSILNVQLRDPGVNMVVGERPTTRRADQPLTRMAQDAVQGSDGHDVKGYRDYRGVPVVGAWQWLDEYDFGVATEMDVEEAFAPAYILRRVLAVLMGLLVATSAAVFLSMLAIARQRRQLLDANLAAEKFGQYALIKKLGSGGMGTVYQAKHALLRRPTAVKVINPEVVSNAAVARFEREVQLMGELTHPNTVAIYDYGRTAKGIFYYAMEYLDGMNLEDFVMRYGPLPETRAVYILRQVCASLAEAHAAGMIHRDVKPANIILTSRGGQHDFVKVLDFGLAKPFSDDQRSDLTTADTLAGTPLYVSPEAVTRSDDLDARADVYALGALGYFLLTGVPVFTGTSATDICLKHVHDVPQSPTERIGQPFSPALEQLLLRCLAKSPSDRPADAAELLELLEACPIAGHWSASDAARWWADRDRSHSAATRILSASDTWRSRDPSSGEAPQSGGDRAGEVKGAR